MADNDDFDRQDYMVDVEWRWTSVPNSVVGLHTSVLLGIPFVFITLFSKIFIFAWIGYIVLVAVLNMQTGLSPVDYIKLTFTKLVTGNKWSVR